MPADTPLRGTAGDGSRRLTCLVHERFTEFAGSERVVAELAEMFLEAPVLAPIAMRHSVPDRLGDRLGGGSLNRYVHGGRRYAHLLPLLPLAMRRLPVGQPDVVIASHHAFASQVVHATQAPVVAYVHSPARWVWDSELRRGETGGATGLLALSAFSAAFRPADKRAAGRLHTIVANSRAVAARVEEWWNRSAVVVPPPVDTDRYTVDPTVRREDFFLLAGRLVPYKMPQLAVRAARAAGVRLVVAGEGRAQAECQRLAGPETTFLGRVDDSTLRDLYRRCTALVMPGVEDFGIVPVEAQACGTPVVAVEAGGALDTVLPGQTGMLVDSSRSSPADAVGMWAAALQSFSPADYDPDVVRKHAEGFSRAAFRSRMNGVVQNVL